MTLHLHFNRAHIKETSLSRLPSSIDKWSAMAPRSEKNARQQAIKRVIHCIDRINGTLPDNRMFINLDLSDLPLSDINWGREVYEKLSALPNLFIRNSRLTSLPPEIGLCRQLRLLKCENTPLETLPEELENCKELQTLSITNGRLKELSSHLFELPQLHTINLDNNNISHIDNTFAFGNMLTTVCLDNNPLIDVPEFIKQLGPQIVSMKNNH
jgi:Leucine-rich repeat (LRR) protein